MRIPHEDVGADDQPPSKPQVLTADRDGERRVKDLLHLHIGKVKEDVKLIGAVFRQGRRDIRLLIRRVPVSLIYNVDDRGNVIRQIRRHLDLSARPEIIGALGLLRRIAHRAMVINGGGTADRDNAHIVVIPQIPIRAVEPISVYGAAHLDVLGFGIDRSRHRQDERHDEQRSEKFH